MKSPIGEINMDEPRGLYVGPRGTLLITDWSENAVLSYPPGDSYKKYYVHTQDLSRPMFPIVDGSGNLWVSNANNGTVVKYPKGSTSASQVLQIGSASAPAVEADGMDFDTHGNLYVAYRTQYNTPGGSVEEFAPGSTTGTILGMSLNQPEGLIVDKDGNIIVSEIVSIAGPNAQSHVVFFPAGATTPALMFSIPGTGGSAGQLAITKYQSLMFDSSENGTIYTLPYPFTASTPVQVKDVPQGIPVGIALSNGQTF